MTMTTHQLIAILALSHSEHPAVLDARGGGLAARPAPVHLTTPQDKLDQRMVIIGGPPRGQRH
jgi:hypothetical protein